MKSIELSPKFKVSAFCRNINKNDAKDVTKNVQKSFKKGPLGAQKVIFGALGLILGCVGNAMFF